jgi:uncharacterized membrane protein YeiB
VSQPSINTVSRRNKESGHGLAVVRDAPVPWAATLSGVQTTDFVRVTPLPAVLLEPSARVSRSNTKPRIAGFDLARGLAIWGMITVHFSEMLAFGKQEPGWLYWCLQMLDGRAAATFFILAGIGISMQSRGCWQWVRISQDGNVPDSALQKRAVLGWAFARRGLFLLVAGLLLLTIWEGDILRIYGISLFIVIGLLCASNRRLLTVTACFGVAFIGLLAFGDYDREWNWASLKYHDLWTASGLIRNLFFNGFRSVFPWTGFLLFGMWLGRLPLDDRIVQRRMLIWSVLIAFTSEIASWLLVTCFRECSFGWPERSVVALLGTKSMPPLPLFLLAAGSTAVAVIAGSLIVADRWSRSQPIPAVMACGRMALTWYIVHIMFLGFGGFTALGLTGYKSLPIAFIAAAVFFAGICEISLPLQTYGHRGPFEWLIRKFAGEDAMAHHSRCAR